MKQCFTYTVSATDRELKARDNLFVNEVLPPINTSNQMPTLGINRFFSGTYFHLSRKIDYRKVASSRPVYYSILNSFGQRSQYVNIKLPLHKQSENPSMCY